MRATIKLVIIKMKIMLKKFVGNDETNVEIREIKRIRRKIGAYTGTIVIMKKKKIIFLILSLVLFNFLFNSVFNLYITNIFIAYYYIYSRS